MARLKSGARWDDDWRKINYLDWLLTPPPQREPRTKTELASLFEVTVRTLNNWSEEPLFREEWQHRVTQVIGDPGRAQRIMDQLFLDATDPKGRNRVSAAKLYLEATNAIKPSQMEVTVRKTSELSDDELDALLAQGAAALAQERQRGDATDRAADA